jgi:hypothetical protein
MNIGDLVEFYGDKKEEVIEKDHDDVIEGDGSNPEEEEFIAIPYERGRGRGRRGRRGGRYRGRGRGGNRGQGKDPDLYIPPHIQMKVQQKLETPEQIIAWREERRARYPTRANIQQKNEERQQRIERGELVDLPKINVPQTFDRPHHQNYNRHHHHQNYHRPYHQNYDRSYHHSNRPPHQTNQSFQQSNIQPQQTNDQLPQQNIEIKEEIQSQQSSEQPQQPSEQPHQQINDQMLVDQTNEKPPQPNDQSHQPPQQPNDQSHQPQHPITDDQPQNIKLFDEQQKNIETTTETIPQTEPISQTDPVKPPQYRNRNDNYRGKRRGSFHNSRSYKKPKHEVMLRQKLMEDSIRNERIALLQCIRYIVSNNFFQPSTNNPDTIKEQN